MPTPDQDGRVRRREGGPVQSFFQLLVLTRAWGSSWGRAEIRACCSGKTSSPQSSRWLRGPAWLPTSATWRKDWCQSISILCWRTLTLTWQRWSYFLENITLAFKETSYLGWETHIFHRHGLLWCFIKTPGTIFATQDMYTSKTIP